MAKETKAKSDEWTPLGVGIGVTIVALIMAYIILISSFMAKVYDPAAAPEPTAATLGQLGDFVGGLMNPVLAFLTFIGAVATVYYAYRQYEAQAEALRHQRAFDLLTAKVKSLETLATHATRERQEFASVLPEGSAAVQMRFEHLRWKENAAQEALAETIKRLEKLNYPGLSDPDPSDL
ncbi:hypothetical protein GFK26_18110 [Variovorax paradoxus]|uniref:Uncharacterized protein n=1 Tax=Variovorax paradoxus TaxID=34073 RepID=A0A5Q0M4S8_VARPD|nr:hypothetical protein [Variovorax paradoxus]QFZ84543.1 hypothetical protein GFK26_18110 [Variovorax paradoxus]